MRLSPEAISALALSSGALGQVVQWGIARRQGMSPTQRLANSTFKGSLRNDVGIGGYFATVEIGTPSQKLTLQLDTGSSDVWVPDSGAGICLANDNQGCPLGSFTPLDSSTFDEVGKGDFQISYIDNSTSTGDYFTDRFQLGAASLDNFTMGLGIHTTIPFGVVGIGYASNEAAAVQTTQQSYPNLPLALQNAGLINTAAFSLWLNDLGSSSGNILFGGIDTGEYVGELTKMPILPDKGRNTYEAFAVSMFSLEATSPSGSDILTSAKLPLAVMLDSGTTLTYLPEDMARQVWDEVGATFDTDEQAPLLPCSFANHEGYFSFVFVGPNGPRINATMDELVLPLIKGTAHKFNSDPNSGQSICQFGIQSQPGPPYLLGDTFLRSAYVVYDLANNEIAIAPTNFNSTKSNVVAFASRGASIPSATPASSQGSSNSPPQPTQKGSLSAAKGFQNQSENAAAFRRPLSGPRLAAVGVTLAYQLMTSWSVGRRP